MPARRSIIPAVRIHERIIMLRGQRVMIDSDLANLYGVTTRRLNEQVKRNRKRFPRDFMFRLTPKEKEQVVANCDHLKTLKFSPGLPNAFTEHGAVMAASVLNSRRAVEISIYVVRAFVKLREILGTHRELTNKLVELENRIAAHDDEITALFEAIRHLMEPTEKPSKRIGFSSVSQS